MGNARWSNTDWSSHAKATSRKNRSEIFTQERIHDYVDPTKIDFRESRDSDANPDSTPIVLAVDETGSMGILAEIIIKRGLGTIMASIYDRKPVTDPSIMCMAIGDAYSDRAPLQVTQFESSVAPLTDQVAKLWLEGQGGGNGGESYPLAWLFVAAKTKCDAIKRGRKGYLFTIGDEAPHPTITRAHAKEFAGISTEADMDAELLLKTLQKDWNIFHLIVETDATRSQNAIEKWQQLLGERAIVVSDMERLAEGIVNTIQLCEGKKSKATYDVADRAIIRSRS